MKKTLILLLSLFIFIPRALALEECTPSDEYLEYLNLSEEERMDVIEPIKCKEAYNKGNDIETIINKNIDTVLGAKTSLTRYSSVDDNLQLSVGNQYSDGTCWAFAATSVIEANALKNGLNQINLSEAHVAYSLISGFYSDQLGRSGKYNTNVNGGTITYFASYLFNNKGMLSESELPYYNNTVVTPVDVNSYKRNLKTITNSEYQQGHDLVTVDTFEYFNIDNLQSCTFNEIYNIKRRVVEHGSVVATIYTGSNNVGTYYLDRSTSQADHAVAIVGWDDSISKNNFAGASVDGAWIVKNSWGTDFGDNGYFYVSYDDSHVCNMTTSYHGVSTKNYDYTYSASDMVGTNATQFREVRTYIASRFTKQSSGDETIKKISYGTALSDGVNKYKVYVTFEDNWQDYSKWIVVGQDTGSVIGIDSMYTDIPIQSDTYTVIVEIYAPTSFMTFTMAKDCTDTAYFNYESGKNYYSYNLYSWRDFSNEATPLEPTLYVYTDTSDVNDSTIDVSNVETINETSTIYYTNNQNKNINNIKVFDGTNDITNQFTINTNTNDIEIVNTNKISGLFKVVITDEDNKKVNTSIHLKERLTIPPNYTYDKDKNIIYIPPETTVDYFKYIITVVNSNFDLIGTDNTALNTGYVKSGSTLETNDSIYYIFVKGDVNGDGLVNSGDIYALRKYLLGTDMNVFKKLSADINLDEVINSGDIFSLRRILLNG